MQNMVSKNKNNNYTARLDREYRVKKRTKKTDIGKVIKILKSIQSENAKKSNN